MKNLRKVFAMVTALSAICMSASAFAATTATGAFNKAAVTGDYSGIEDGSNTVVATVDTTLAQTGTQMTFIVLDDDAVEESLAAGDILYIDQKELKAGDNSFTGAINLDRVTGAEGTLPDGSYVIKLGFTDSNGDFQIAKATMVVTTEEEGGQTVTVRWGDITLDGSISGSDPLAIMYFMVDDVRSYPAAATESLEAGAFTVGSTVGGIRWGDVTLDGSISGSDPLAIMYFMVDDVRTYSEHTVGANVDIELAE